MVRRHIPNETKELALSMSLQGISDLEIRELTGISERSVKRLRRIYRNSGSAAQKSVASGRPRTLSSVEVEARCLYLSHLPPQLISFSRQFLCDCVKRQPDMSLAELQGELRGVCGVGVSLKTVLRTLQQEGYTMRMVCQPLDPVLIECSYS
jgi:transposase